MTEEHVLTPEQERDHARWLVGAKTGPEILSEAPPPWIIHGWLLAGVTMLTGRPKAGKSTLARGIVTAVMNGTDWHGEPIIPGPRKGPVMVICSDPGDQRQWAEELKGVGGEVSYARYDKSHLQSGEYLSAAQGLDCRLVVVDNLTSMAEGNIMDSDPTALLKPLSDIADAGFPVLVLAHTNKAGGKTPSGPTAYEAWARHLLNVSVTTKSGRKVSRWGNHGTFPDVPLQGDSEGSTGPSRSPETLDKNQEIAIWIVENCQGVGVNEVGRLAGAHFDEKVSSTTTSLKQGALFKLLVRTGEGTSTTWKLAER